MGRRKVRVAVPEHVRCGVPQREIVVRADVPVIHAFRQLCTQVVPQGGDGDRHTVLVAPQVLASRYANRQLLVTTGVLPERDDDLERLPAWLDQTLAGKPVEHARLFRPFTHWFLLRRARRRDIASVPASFKARSLREAQASSDADTRSRPERLLI
jgi:hypothetical protein